MPDEGKRKPVRSKVGFAAPGLLGRRPFSDLDPRQPVSNPALMLEGWRNVREAGLVLERAVGPYVTISATLLQILADYRRAVAHVSASGLDFEGVPGEWNGTGFLVSPNLFLTNHHVLNSIEVAAEATVEFDFEIARNALLGGRSDIAPSRKVFRLNPRRLYVSSPANGGLDYAFVWVDEVAASEFGFIPLERSSFTMSQGEQAFVIHHPDRRTKEVSVDDTDVLAVESSVIHYASDTDSGSSGAPVINRQGDLIALHHATRLQSTTLSDGHVSSYVNEGVKIAAIALDLEAKAQGGTAIAAHAREALAAIRGSDTLTGFFGGLGRRPRGANDLERVVDTYTGDEADVDIGFWNIEHLASRYDDDAKHGGAATVVADMKLDAWGLSEVSPNAVRRLVERVRADFGEEYGCAFSEPDAPDGRQTTAVIWRTATLDCTPVAWPAEVAGLFDLDSRDPEAARFEAVHGRIFNRHPGLFRLTTKATFGDVRFAVHVVPLHLKAMAEGSLRRRMASGILRRAVEALKSVGVEDVILGGDVNAALASGDFDRLTAAGFVAMGARDEQDGAFTYLKTPHRSLIDNIFLSPNLARTHGADEFLIVARDREIGDYIRSISDHRPIMMRLSLAVGADADGPPLAVDPSFDVDALLDGVLRGGAGAPGPGVPERITFNELKRRMSDPAIPDSELRPYLRITTADSGPFRPKIEPDPDRVVIDALAQYDLENAIDWGNGASRWRRRVAFDRRIEQKDPRPVLLCEGDSWLQFPIFIDDVVDHLSASYNVRCLSAAGDTADNIIHRNPEYWTELLRLRDRLAPLRRSVAAIVISAAGNDVIGADASGRSVLLDLLRDFKPGKPASWHLQPAAVKRTFDFLESGYGKIIATVRGDPSFRALPIVFHGYDYAIPGGWPGDPRRPLWAEQDKWLGKPMRAKGIVDHDLQRAIVRLLIDRLYAMLAKLAGNSAATRVYVVDVRGALGPVQSWADEIHGTSTGFANVAARFKAVIDEALSGR
jgi:hypothetical protein